MYLSHFKLKSEPFHITPNPDFLYLSQSHREALAAVVYGVQQRKGFILISGEVGTGKTTILRSYLERCSEQPLKMIYLFNSNLSFPSLLRRICRELGSSLGEDVDDTLSLLHRFLIDEYGQGRTVVLIIDEAQNMPAETLENLRMLSNLETSKDKLIQIVFSGQPEFEEMLERHELRQLKQRIAVRATISRLSKNEGMEYIRHRLAKAELSGAELFTRGALSRIVDHAHGVPRTINILCDHALITAFGRHKTKVGRRIANAAIVDFEGKLFSPLRPLSLFRLVLLLLAITFGLLFAERPSHKNAPAALSHGTTGRQP